MSPGASPGSILLTGASGLLGFYLAPALSTLGRTVGIGFSRTPAGDLSRTVDLSSRSETERLLAEIRPEVIVHAAALADVDTCQRDPEQAFRANVAATSHLVEWISIRSPNTLLVLISTDQVYGLTGPHREGEAHPVNVYGSTKLSAERLARSCRRHLVLRVSFVGLGKSKESGFAAWLLHSLKERRTITLVKDVLFCPLHAAQTARFVTRSLKLGLLGTYNLGASGGGISKADFGRLLGERLDYDLANAKPGSILSLDLPAPRPLDMRMESRAIETAIGCKLPSVDATVEELAREWQTR